MTAYRCFLLATRIVPHVPTHILEVVGWLAGVAAFILARGPRQAVFRNLAVVCPELSRRQRGRLAVETFIHGAWGYIELFATPSRPLAELRHSFDLHDAERINTALAEGHGMIMATAHLGSAPYAMQLIETVGSVPVAVLVEPLQPPEMFDLVARLRAAHGMRMIRAEPTSVREVLAALRRGEIVGIASDRDVAGTGELLPFFGRPTRMTTAAAAFALRTSAVIVPGFAFRTGLFKGHAYVEMPIPIVRTGDAARDARQM
ncbi:MAG: phosphatidylinositol dimannoside acyltransferase, partial [Chloroflexota bacterium]|nr:phosphatidylinositol dimannoside acyltransferase [Chloroflexota bacterium]